MKKVLFAALLMITSIAAFSQQAPKAPFRHEGKVEMRGNFQHRPQFAFHPRPLSVTVKGDKVIVIFNSVSDSLFNNDEFDQNGKKAQKVKNQKSENDFLMSAMGNGPKVSRAEFDRFLIDLTITYEFDFIELYTPSPKYRCSSPSLLA